MTSIIEIYCCKKKIKYPKPLRTILKKSTGIQCRRALLIVLEIAVDIPAITAKIYPELIDILWVERTLAKLSPKFCYSNHNNAAKRNNCSSNFPLINFFY